MKPTLSQVRHSIFFEEIEQPEVVFHMTNKNNIDSILKDGKIKVFDDYLCFFFPDLNYVHPYIQLTGADKGKHRYKVVKKKYSTPTVVTVVDPPLNHSDMVIMRLYPRQKEPLPWFREKTEKTIEQYKEDIVITNLNKLFDEARICHYGDFRFKQDSVEIIELTDLDKSKDSNPILKKVLELQKISIMNQSKND